MAALHLTEKGFSLPEGFCVGFSSAVINPPAGVSLAGYGVANARERLSTENWDELKIICTAFSDGENAFLAFTNDSCHFAENVANPLFQLLEEEIGIPEENVFINATHTHAAPVMYSAHESFPGTGDYQRNIVYPAAVRIAGEALRDLSPATILAGRGKTDGISFIRRYLSREDGSFLGNWIEKGQDPEKIMHESMPDEEMQILRLVREGKKDVVMINWQCHPTSAGGSKNTNTSADWVGIVRNNVEKALNVHCVYHQGAAGNIIAYGALRGEKSFAGEKFREHGELISQVALEILAGPMETLKGGKVQAKKQYLPMERKEEKGIANIPISTLSAGDIAFATVPYEMFCQNGMQLKSASPFAMTFMCEVTDGDYNYVPAAESFDNGGYEVKICPFTKGAGEKVVGELLTMLNEFHASQNEKM